VDETTERARTIRWDDPRRLADLRRTMPGVELLKAVAAGDLPSPPMGRLMNIRLADVERGRIVFTAELGEYHYNPLGMIHGGFAATILDSAMGCCVQSCLEAGDLYTTLDLKVNYLKALRLDAQGVRAIATLIHIGRTTALVEGKLIDAADVLYAHGTSTCLIKRADPRER
jgi:uncharacterized protein (TIGR00369 family)